MTHKMAGLIFLVCVMVPTVCSPSLAEDSDGQRQTRHEKGTPVDPVYAEVAAKTGGRVYDMRNPEDRRAFERDLERPQREERRRREAWDLSRLSDHLPWSGKTSLLIYALLKWMAYAGWCWLGLGFQNSRRGRLGRAALWGLGRVGLGIAFGLTVGFVFLLAHWIPSAEWSWYVGLYVGIYIPVRWIEWSLMAHAMKVPPLRWRAGGIGVSCVVDLVQMLLLGSLIPVGRFLC